MKRNITVMMANDIIAFAEEHDALVEEKEFKTFNRYIISTPDGTVALKMNKSINNGLGIIPTYCWLENFHGFDNKAASIADAGVVELKGYCYV